jgi:hypothetical protein
LSHALEIVFFVIFNTWLRCFTSTKYTAIHKNVPNYCNILNHRLSSWPENNNILYDEQNGFRRGRSCEEHIHSLYTILNDRKISKKSS